METSDTDDAGANYSAHPHSAKSVRHETDSGAMLSYRVGRRVLVGYRDADTIGKRAPTMTVANPTETPIIDPATGRLRPLSDEERSARFESLRRTLEELAGIADESDTEEVWDEIFRGLAAARPEYPPADGTS